MTCLEIKEILKKHNVTGYSKLCKQELVNLVKKTLNKKKIKKGGLQHGNVFLNVVRGTETNTQILPISDIKQKISRITNTTVKEILLKMIELPISSNEYKRLYSSLDIYKNTNPLIDEYLELYSRL